MIEAIFGLIGVVVGSFLAIAKDSFAAWKQRKQEGSYSAIRLICILHEYADHCVDVVKDNGTIQGMPAGRTADGQEYYEPQVREPEPPHYPEDIAWRSLPKDLMYQVLGLANKARTTGRHIEGTYEYVATPPDYSEFFEARQEGYAKLGYDALHLAERLAERYRIKSPHTANLGFEWDVKAFLRDTISEFENLRKQREAKNFSLLGNRLATPPNLESSKNEK